MRRADESGPRLAPLTYRVRQAAEILNVPQSTVYDWVRTRTIASVRIGAGQRQVILIPADAIQRFIDNNLVPTRG